ncbi:MAG: response regulator, partial [Thiohalobacterales bacterium]|nr:response regulator [Thiohalobacterales bacterium]
PMDFEGEAVGLLELQVDVDAMLADKLEPILAIERLLLVLLVGITALIAVLQDRWIRRPIKSLADATSQITHGNYAAELPKASGRDEVGKLISTIDSMRTSLANRESRLAEHHTLLNAITKAQSSYIRDADAMALFDKLLLDILGMTGSEYGFIGEVLYRDNQPYLRTLAISNIAWNAETRKFYDENAPRGLEFTNLDTLFGAAIKSGDTVIANSPGKDRRSGGLPEGHPPLNAFLGVPFFRGDKVIGMFGIANRAAGYDHALVEFLGPITATCTQIVEALKADRQRELTEAHLRERETLMRTIFENVVDGIITTNDEGFIESFNRAAENMFGYSAEEVVGRNVSILTPAPHRDRHCTYISNFLEGKESRIMGAGREVEGVRKDGSAFPIDIAITEMWIGEDRYFCSIMRDITERRKVDRMKNEFVSTVSHELRTPLTSIRGALGLVGGGATGELPEKAQPLVDIAAKNCDRLIRLINDILDIEKIEANKMEFTIQALELMPLVTQAVESNRVYAVEHGASIVIYDDMPDAVVRVDEDRFMQVLTNLLSNAAKYSPEGGTIGVTVQPLGGGVRLTVSDEGPGIPEEFRGQIFNKFSQADSSDTRQRGGTGLGLSITRAIVEKLGGHISFDTRDGKGTSFHVDLPVEEALSAATCDTRNEYVSVPLDGTRILICEDDRDIAHLLALMLQSHGFTADIAHTAAEARTLLEQHDYGAMTLDLMLPDRHGIDLFREIREHDKTRELPVVVVSAIASEEEQQLSGDAIQIIDWIDKPIDEKRLIDALACSMKQSSRAPLRILHVEDEADARKIVCNIVGDRFDITAAATLAEARELLERETFGLVILDLGLPDGSGISLLPELAGGGSHIPVVLFSAREVDAETARGVAATLVKSNTSNEILLETIQTTIAEQPPLAKEA